MQSATPIVMPGEAGAALPAVNPLAGIPAGARAGAAAGAATDAPLLATFEQAASSPAADSNPTPIAIWLLSIVDLLARALAEMRRRGYVMGSRRAPAGAADRPSSDASTRRSGSGVDEVV